MKNTFGLPEVLFEFLKEQGNKKIDISGLNREIEKIKFFGADELKEDFTILDTYEYHTNYGEFDKDPELSYWIPSVDLIKEDCEDNYDSEGLLIWFPLLKCFGSSDIDHQLIYVFPNISWENIYSDLGGYINTQWYPETTKNLLLMPWKEQGFGVSFDKFIKREQ